MTRNTIVILAIALVGVLSVIMLRQRSTIESLRQELAVAKESPELPPVQSTHSFPPEVSQVSTPSASPTSMPPVPVIPLSTAATTVVATNGGEHLRQVLDEQVQRLQAELEQARRLVPEPEDASAAYVGPGVWANVNLQTTGTRKLAITGEAKKGGTVSIMTIKAWGACSPTDCEWPEVPFFLLDRFDGPSKYRRGFAVWEFDSDRRVYFLITFEKSGLRIDTIHFRSGRLTPYSVVEWMTRIQ